MPPSPDTPDSQQSVVRLGGKKLVRISSKKSLCICALGLLFVAHIQLHASSPIAEQGGFYTTPKDLARLRAQASDPRLQDAYREVRETSDKALARWEKAFPAATTPRSTADLLAAGRAMANRDNDYSALAIECALSATPQIKRVLREMMLVDLGWREQRNYWNGMGIHDGLATSEFLEAYDVGAQSGVFTADDHAAIREEMHQAGHFFEEWLLNNPYSRMYSDKREEAWCLNFHVFSASSLSWIAMLYPEFPESKDWLRKSESSLVEYLMSGFSEDGAYGEESVLYWRHTNHALFNFFLVSKNLGVADYLAIPAIYDRVSKSLHWRLDLTAPDGNVFAIGDSERTGGGHSIVNLGGDTLVDPELTWGGRMMFERANHWKMDDISPLFLAHLDLGTPATAPAHRSALYPESGFATFRSGWDDKADALFFKFGTSFIGHRESERDPVISGHAHEDSLEVELHYRGAPVLADGGRHGHYETWNIYGGFSKATIAHSTVGLGNPWGYDRLDGQYANHQADRGPDFTYERPQQNIGRADTHLAAFGDLGQVAFTSAKVRTFDAVQHQRSIVWFPADGLTILADHLDSATEQPYEWYLTPIGNPLGKSGALIFGDDTARLQVLPILPAAEKITTISRSTANVPPYYIDLGTNATPLQSADRWSTYSLLILQKQAKSTDFLNVLLPFSGDKNPWTVAKISPAAQRLTMNDKEVLVSGESADRAISVAGQCGVVSRQNATDQTYALIEGTKLSRAGQTLLSSVLNTPVWKARYSTKINALISLVDKRAAIDLKPWPGDTTLLLNPPLAIPGKEPTALLLTAVSFHVDARPTKMLILHSFDGDLKWNDPDFDRHTQWARDYHATVAKREAIDFTYDAATGLVTVLLEPGEHQLLWQ